MKRGCEIEIESSSCIIEKGWSNAQGVLVGILFIFCFIAMWVFVSFPPFSILMLPHFLHCFMLFRKLHLSFSFYKRTHRCWLYYLCNSWLVLPMVDAFILSKNQNVLRCPLNYSLSFDDHYGIMGFWFDAVHWES